MKTRLLLLALTVLPLAAGGAASGQQPAQPAPTFRAEVNYVEVDARVFDEKGTFITTLDRNDFQVFEDGRLQQVQLFSLINIPVERAERPLFASRPIEPDVQTNMKVNEGRIYLLVLDDIHTAALRSQRTRAAARQFIERHVGANDLAAVVFTSGRSDAAQDFTGNPRLLLASVDRFMGNKLRSATLNRIDEEFRTRDTRAAGDPIADIDASERGFQARNMLETVRNLATYLGGVRGRRKALVLFSEGIDYDIYDVMNTSGNSRDATDIMQSTRDVIAEATRANVAIYGVDPRGLTGMGDDLITVQSFPDDTSLGIGTGSLYNELRLAQDSLRTLSDETGGFAVVNRNDFATAFQRIVDDNSSYYILGYYPTNERRDGRYRKIEVRVPTRPGLTIRARRGYVAARGRAPEVKPAGPNSASPELREAMNSPLPAGGVPMAATAAVFKGPAPNGSVVVSTLIGASIPLVEKDGLQSNDIEMAIVAVDQKGKAFNTDRTTLNLNMKPDTAARFRALGFRTITSLNVPPGRYTLRIGAREANTKTSGSVSYDIEVPDFSKEPLSMSSLALTSAASSLTPTARPQDKDPLAKLLPGPMTSYREFPQNDQVAFFVEVYDTQASKPHKVDLSATVKAEGGQTVFQTREERDSSELKGSSGGFGFMARIPLKEMAPALYVLRVEAQSRLGDRPQAAREVVFRVVPAAAPQP
jgi:VWFA-related protein